nr:hypothetical protein [Pseudonocardia sp. ICBG1142]
MIPDIDERLQFESSGSEIGQNIFDDCQRRYPTCRAKPVDYFRVGAARSVSKREVAERETLSGPQHAVKLPESGPAVRHMMQRL